jgi:hypothetical protein
VPIEAALASVELGAYEPLGVWQLPIEQLVPRLAEHQLRGLTLPKRLGRLQALFVELLVLGAVAARALHELGAGLEGAGFGGVRFDGRGVERHALEYLAETP